MKIIGLAGPARSGKDTIAMHMERYGYYKMAFADPLRDMLRALNIPEEYIQDRKEDLIPGLGVSFRHLAQTLGTEWGRNQVANDFWLRLLVSAIDEHADDSTYIVITDVRFAEEAKWVRNNGSLWHVRRPGQDAAATRPHTSESGIDRLPGEPILINDGDIHHLLDQVDRLMHSSSGSDRA